MGLEALALKISFVSIAIRWRPLALLATLEPMEYTVRMYR